LVGILGGDWLMVRRAENLAQIVRRAKEHLDARGTKPIEPPTLSLTLPLMIAAADESRNELKEIWASLLAAAVDPARQKSFRHLFIEIAKGLDPLDAILLKALQKKPRNMQLEQMLNWIRELPHNLKMSHDEFAVSCLNLESLRLIINAQQHNMTITPLAREFLRAIED
jgi:hypothetical protein